MNMILIIDLGTINNSDGILQVMTNITIDNSISATNECAAMPVAIYKPQEIEIGGLSLQPWLQDHVLPRPRTNLSLL